MAPPRGSATTSGTTEMAGNGWQDLGDLLGGGPSATYQRAFDEGRYRSAQTEEALSTARVKQQEAIGRDRREKDTTEMKARAASTPGIMSSPDDAMMALIMAAEMGDQYKSLSAGMGDQQDQRFRAGVANVNTTNEQRLRNLQAIEGKPSADIQAVGANDFVNLADELQLPEILPSEQARINAGGDGTPQWQNYQNLIKLDPTLAGAETFGNIVKGPQVINAGGVPMMTPSIGAGPNAAPRNLATAQTVAQNTALVNQGKAEGTQAGNSVAAAPGHVSKIDAMAQSIDKLLAHPGMKTVYGPSGLLDPRNYVPGTDAQGAKALLDNINAQSFMVSVKEMRGLGALSNAEGLKVQQAFTYATNPNLSDQEAAEAWQNLRVKLDGLRAAAEKESQNSVLRPPGAGAVAPAAAGGPPPGFVLMEDAAGNKAYVGPNGEVQEL